MIDRFIRLPELKTIVGMGRSTIYRRIQAGEFPEPKKLGANISAWLSSDVEAWVSRMAGTAQ